jgi:hypothetical protein
MVKIFTLDELVAGDLPLREDYRGTVDFLRRRYQTLVDDGHVYGVLFYGSLFKNNGSGSMIGSDVDHIVVVNNLDANTLDKIRIIRGEVSSLPTPIEFHTLDIETIREGHHGYEKTFLEDLRMHVTDECIVGNNILEIMEPEDRNDYGIFKDRHIKNLRRLSRGVSAPKYSRTHCTFLGRIINYAVYLARDMLYLKHGKHATEGGKLLSKECILTRYEHEFPEVEAGALRNVIELRAQYSEFLDGMKPYDATRYKEILDGIDDCYKTMQEFVRANFKEAEKMVSTT